MSGQTPAELAEAYLDALESKSDQEEYGEALNRRDALQERLKRFEESYGGSDPATQELREKVETAENRVEELEEERQEPEVAERELLEAATSFLLNEEWLQPDVIRALNRALTGERRENLLVDDIEFTELADITEIDDVERFDIIDVVRKLVLDKLGETDDIQEVWQSLAGSSREDPFRVVAELGKADPEDVMEAMEEDIERSVARNRLKSAVYQLDVNPYHREDGTYRLSTAGQYIAANYAEIDGSDMESEEGSGDASEEESTESQTTLVEEATVANGGGSDE